MQARWQAGNRKPINLFERPEIKVKGFASIEAFLNEQSQRWNQLHHDELLADSKQRKVSLDDKIDIWIPKMTGGKKLNKGDIRWQHFKQLCTIRDHFIIHPKLVDTVLHIKSWQSK